VAFTVAWVHLSAAIEGRKPDTVDKAELALAVQWAGRARTLGSAAASNLLYMIHGNGYGGPVDMPKAIAYLKEAAEKGDPGARTNYAIMLYSGTPDIPRDRALAAKFLVALNQEDKMMPAAYYHLGLLKYTGEGGQKKDEKAGMELIEMAAEGGDGEAQQDTGRNYEYGWTVKPDLGKAIEWYEKAAAAGEGWALWRMGMVYVDGEGRAADSDKAVEYFRKSAEAGSPDGMTSLAVMYATGDGLKQDFAEARRYYEQAADAGSEHALLNLAGMYLRGEGVTVDMVQAYVLASIAEQRGSEQAGPMRRGLEKELSDEQRSEAKRRLADEK
jgi:TPR repeat protein